MGLGPPVCRQCEVIYAHDNTREGRSWYCKCCGDDTASSENSLFLLSESDRHKYELASDKVCLVCLVRYVSSSWRDEQGKYCGSYACPTCKDNTSQIRVYELDEQTKSRL